MTLKSKKILIHILAAIVLVTVIFAFYEIAHAQLFKAVENIGEAAKLPGSGVLHGKSAADPGAAEITSIIFTVIDAIKYLVGTLAIIILVVSGVRLVAAGSDTEKVSESQKKNITYAIVTLIIIILADVLVKQVFFGESGDVLENEATAKLYATQGTALVEGIYGFMTKFLGAVAILVIVASGLAIAFGGGSEDSIKKNRTRILWALGGLILAGIAEFVIKEIIFPAQGTQLPSIEKAKILLVKLTNFITGFISTAAVVSIIYAGFLYVTGATNEENTKKAKTIITGAVIGLIVSLAAFAIVHTTIEFDGDKPALSPIGAPPSGFETMK